MTFGSERKFIHSKIPLTLQVHYPRLKFQNKRYFAVNETGPFMKAETLL